MTRLLKERVQVEVPPKAQTASWQKNTAVQFPKTRLSFFREPVQEAEQAFLS